MSSSITERESAVQEGGWWEEIVAPPPYSSLVFQCSMTTSTVYPTSVKFSTQWKKPSVVQMSVEGLPKITSSPTQAISAYMLWPNGCDPAMAQDKSKPLSKTGILRYDVFLPEKSTFSVLGLFLNKCTMKWRLSPYCTCLVGYKFYCAWAVFSQLWKGAFFVKVTFCLKRHLFGP